MSELATAVLRNRRKTAILLLYLATTVVVLAWRFAAYADAPTLLVPVARAAAAGIYLNFALVLLPMARLLLSRRTLGALRVLLPVHQAIESHAIAGGAILAFSVVHVAAYAGMFVAAHEVYARAAYPSAVVTGVVLTALLGLLAWGVRARTRGRFEAFYYTHFLTIPIGVLALIHAPWMPWVAGGPLALYLADRLVRLLVMARPARVAHVQVEGRDLALHVERPTGFGYAAGDYAFLCVPAVSRLQWHPFSLVNAPSDAGHLAFRIRRTGDWTKALADVPVGTPILVDGPFASPCRDLHGCRRAVVVAAGIGITPFASFLAHVEQAAGSFDRLHLVWLERDEASFGWLYATLERAAATHGGALTVSLIAAGATRPLCSPGPVDWDAELARVGSDATLFFCGPRPLSDDLRERTRRIGMRFRTESF